MSEVEELRGLKVEEVEKLRSIHKVSGRMVVSIM